MTGGIWSLTQTLNGFSTDSKFGYALSYSSTGTQFAVGAPYTNSNVGMYEMIWCMHIIIFNHSNIFKKMIHLLICTYKHMLKIIPRIILVVILVILITILLLIYIMVLYLLNVIIWYIWSYRYLQHIDVTWYHFQPFLVYL